MEFISSQTAKYIDLAASYETFGQLYELKLWHQLTVKLDEFLSERQNLRSADEDENSFFELYTNFVDDFAARINPIKLAMLVSKVGRSFKKSAVALAFFQQVLSSKSGKQLSPSAVLCIEMDIALIHVQIAGEKISSSETADKMDTDGGADSDSFKEAKHILAEAKEKLSGVHSTETLVFSNYYRAESELRRRIGPPQEFYKTALLYLAYTPPEDIPAEDAYALATDVALAALTADNVFNFGEALQTSQLSVLIGTENEWLRGLLQALHKGSVVDFNTAVQAAGDKYFSAPALACRHEEVKKKAVLMSVCAAALERHPHDREISFAELAHGACISIDQVEWVLMRGMSLGLFKGVIDGVDQSVNISWVLPRVLDTEQISLLKVQMDNWSDRVRTTLLSVEDQTVELL